MEQKIFKEGNYAITTHRVIWANDGVFDYDDLQRAFVMKDDWWKGTAIGVVVGAILVAIGATWSIIVGLLCFVIAFFMWKGRADTLFLVGRDGKDIKLKIPNSPPGLTNKVQDALREREDIVARQNQASRASAAQDALAQVDNMDS